MANRTTTRAREAPRRRRDEERRDTKTDLLEAAGHVFAEKGFDRATGKEICQRAGANAAAINYYFGGMDKLYLAVLEEANGRLFSFEALSLAIAGKTDPKEKLRIVVELAVDKLTGPIASSWAFAVLGREFVAPSPALDWLREKQAAPKARVIRSIVGELMALPEDHPAVARAALSIIAPFLMLVVADRRTIKRVLPSLGLSRADAPALAAHMFDYAISGVAAIARQARKKDGLGK
jgi:AcrR family transcriptional regulator